MFWALRGGGGGTYGVVTSVTYLTFPPVSLIRATINVEFPSSDIAQDVTTKYLKLHPSISDAGWSASIALSKSSFSGALQAPSDAWAAASEEFYAFVAYVEQAVGGRVQATETYFDSFYEFYLATLAKGEITGSQVELASRLLPRTLAETDPAKVAEILLSVGVSLR